MNFKVIPNSYLKMFNSTLMPFIKLFQFLFLAKDCFGKGEWGMNVGEFQRRFDPSHTDGEGPHWLKNLYFVYLLELRAIAKAGSYFENELFYTGNDENDKEVRIAVKKLVEIAR